MYKSLATISTVCALFAISYAQSIVPSAASSTFPACAVNCAALLQAQQTCTAASSQLAQDNCFCQSSPANSLETTPDQVCTSECPNESDRTELQTWFINFCGQVAKGIDPVSGANTPTSTSAISSAASSASAATVVSSSSATPTISGTSSGSSSASPSGKTWIDEHWKWVMAIAIIIVGLIVIALAAVCLKRRHRRKTEAARARAGGFPTPNEKRYGARSATPELWGPHQHMAATQGWDYQDYPRDRRMEAGVLLGTNRKSGRVSNSKGKTRDRVEVAEVGNGLNTQQSRRDGRAPEMDEIRRDESQRPRDRETDRSTGKNVAQKLRGIKSRA